jgi:hypothetical protein
MAAACEGVHRSWRCVLCSVVIGAAVSFVAVTILRARYADAAPLHGRERTPFLDAGWLVFSPCVSCVCWLRCRLQRRRGRAPHQHCPRVRRLHPGREWGRGRGQCALHCPLLPPASSGGYRAPAVFAHTTPSSSLLGGTCGSVEAIVWGPISHALCTQSPLADPAWVHVSGMPLPPVLPLPTPTPPRPRNLCAHAV